MINCNQLEYSRQNQSQLEQIRINENNYNKFG